jgi:Holliday junction resolvase RusA-like endonuclease
MKFTFRVPGTPTAKARPRVYRGRAFTPAKTAAYEQRVWEAAEPHIPADWPYDAEYDVQMVFTFKNRLHGDIDNHIKTIDGLNPNRYGRKGVWWDDKQVRSIAAHRTYDPANEGMEVTITALPTKVVYFPKRLAERKPRRKRVAKRKTTKR